LYNYYFKKYDMRRIFVSSLIYLLLSYNFSTAQELNKPVFDSLIMELNKIKEDDTNKVKLLCKISDVCNEEEMLNYLEPALQLAQKINYKSGIARALANISYVAIIKGENLEALKNFKECLKIQEEVGDKNEMATTLNNIGYIYQHFGDISIALSYYTKALRIQEEIGDKKQMANSLANLGFVYDTQGEKQKSYEYYRKSFEINETINDPEGL